MISLRQRSPLLILKQSNRSDQTVQMVSTTRTATVPHQRSHRPTSSSFFQISFYFKFLHLVVVIFNRFSVRRQQGSIWRQCRQGLTPTGNIATLAINSLQKCSRGRHFGASVFYLKIRLRRQKSHKSNPLREANDLALSIHSIAFIMLWRKLGMWQIRRLCRRKVATSIVRRNVIFLCKCSSALATWRLKLVFPPALPGRTCTDSLPSRYINQWIIYFNQAGPSETKHQNTKLHMQKSKRGRKDS